MACRLMNSGFFSIIVIALGLSADCFAVALSGGTLNRKCSRLQILRTSSLFGLFQAVMPVLGWLAGRTVVDLIADYDHWVAFALLVVVSDRMFWESFHTKHSQDREFDITKGLLLITLSIATSIDALAVGLSFAFLKVNIIMSSITIGVVAFLATTIGFIAGKKTGNIIGKWAELTGGIILLVIAFRILAEHIL
jgi:putative Mn2+ efflux pump MntP